MTARYQESQTQRDFFRLIDEVDRNAVDFFVIAPFTLDLGADRAGFGDAVSDLRAQALLDRYHRGELVAVSSLTRPAYAYVRAELKRRLGELDREAIGKIEAFLDD